MGGTDQASVEEYGGAGRARVHWKEDLYQSELMTPIINPDGDLPLSIMTVLSLRDLGYTVEEAAAEPYSIPKSRRLRKEQGDTSVFLGNDILQIEPIDMDDDELELDDDEDKDDDERKELELDLDV